MHGLCSLRPCVGLLVALSATISILVCRMKSGRSPQMVRTMRAGALVIFMSADHSEVGNGIHPCPVPHTGLSLCRLAVVLLCDVPRWSLKVFLPAEKPIRRKTPANRIFRSSQCSGAHCCSDNRISACHASPNVFRGFCLLAGPLLSLVLMQVRTHARAGSSGQGAAEKLSLLRPDA